jgi:hypothetical protein
MLCVVGTVTTRTGGMGEAVARTEEKRYAYKVWIGNAAERERRGRETDHSHLITAELKNLYIHSSLHHDVVL